MSFLQTMIGRFAGHEVLVVGEPMLDRYIRGRADRLCREAPCPVVSQPNATDFAGAAANTALNMAALGAVCRLVGPLGDDAAGNRLVQMLRAAGVGCVAPPLPAGERATLIKTRIMADDQLLARLDEGSTEPLCGAAAIAFDAQLDTALADADLVVVSDYAYGAISASTIDRLAAWREQTGRPIIVDARDLRRHAALRPSAVKPNYMEATDLLGLPRQEGPGARLAQMQARGPDLLALTQAEAVVVTLDRDGALLLRQDAEPIHVPAFARQCRDATGAGDSFVAALALALATGVPAEEALRIASAAAGIVVEKPGTATCSALELQEALAAPARLCASRERIAITAEAHRRAGRRIVFTNGCFDILHRGHLDYLAEARAEGDVLIVGVNSDASVRRLKGPHRPLNACADRIEMLAGLACVDHVIAFEEDTPELLLAAIRPDVFVKGGDYLKSDLPEARLVEEMGGEVRILSYRGGYSTTGLVARIRAAAE